MLGLLFLNMAGLQDGGVRTNVAPTRQQIWRLKTGSRQKITYISAFNHDSNEIPTAIPMFAGSGNTERLVGILSEVRVCRKSKMAAINRKWIGNNVYLSSYTRQQRNSNSYTHVFRVRLHDQTTAETARRVDQL